MVVFNYSGKEINAKVVYYGPGLSGKTTNLEHIYSKTASHLRGKMVSMKTKADRTLFFDFLPIEGGEIAGFKIRFLLYTVPGQVYYNATRKLVLKGADAIVFVADSQAEELPANRESLKNLEANLSEYGKSLGDIPWVIQYNKRDLPSALPLEKLEQELNPTRVPLFEAVATGGTGVFETLVAATKLVLVELRKQLLQDQGAQENVGGQGDSFGAAMQGHLAGAVAGEGREVSSATTDTNPHVPSPGEEASIALATADISCPPYKGSHPGARGDTLGRADTDVMGLGNIRLEGEGAGGSGSRVEGAHLEALRAQVHVGPSGPGSAPGRLTIPVKVTGHGKPGHVLVNLAVDVEIVVDDEDKTV